MDRVVFAAECNGQPQLILQTGFHPYKLKLVNYWYNDNNQNNGFSDNGSFEYNSLEYIYDANGKMTADSNKVLTIGQYNPSYLPQQINITTDGSIEINYRYTANVQKLIKQTKIENAVEQTIPKIVIY